MSKTFYTKVGIKTKFDLFQNTIKNTSLIFQSDIYANISAKTKTIVLSYVFGNPAGNGNCDIHVCTSNLTINFESAGGRFFLDF